MAPSSKPNYDPFSSLTSNSLPTSRSHTPSAPTFPQASKLSSDPFAPLSSPASRQLSPFPQQPQIPPASTSSSLFDFTSPSASTGQKSSALSHQTNGTSNDDEWDFASALPDDTLPTTNQVVVSNTMVNITFKASREGQPSDVVALMARFSNNTPSLITEYTFQVAVTKVRLSRRAISIND